MKKTSKLILLVLTLSVCAACSKKEPAAAQPVQPDIYKEMQLAVQNSVQKCKSITKSNMWNCVGIEALKEAVKEKPCTFKYYHNETVDYWECMWEVDDKNAVRIGYTENPANLEQGTRLFSMDMMKRPTLDVFRTVLVIITKSDKVLFYEDIYPQ